MSDWCSTRVALTERKQPNWSEMESIKSYSWHGEEFEAVSNAAQLKSPKLHTAYHKYLLTHTLVHSHPVAVYPFVRPDVCVYITSNSLFIGMCKVPKLPIKYRLKWLRAEKTRTALFHPIRRSIFGCERSREWARENERCPKCLLYKWASESIC